MAVTVYDILGAPDAAGRASPTGTDSDGGIDAIVNDGDPDSFRWLRPVSQGQAYCRAHFIRECCAYYVQENIISGRDAGETLKPKPTKARKWPTAPTRVQPARRVRDKSREGRSEKETGSRSSPRPGNGTEKPENTALRVRREQLQLHLPWPDYKAGIEGRVTQISAKLYRRQRGGDIAATYANCPIVSRIRPGCRFCRCDSQVVDGEGLPPRRLAPPAPMLLVRLEEVREEQLGIFGGVRFAVDVCGEQEMVILLDVVKVRGEKEEKEARDHSDEGVVESRKRRNSLLDPRPNQRGTISTISTPRKRRKLE
ncbi:hypothetical protein GGS23DRAFT_438682 [Durotheca rogersii]|uniref:uncharacterized protein n=1 Tax=Durotheca rogersii TaxID=419775 RepID=UPI0022210581|nr:uncharacterized protein GGS23DRAFT_438682 [Durotheca rogersii]KAI5856156.1 hypothetical protein GGS23DRAFT_438682 [Durotheca rogersii]